MQGGVWASLLFDQMREERFLMIVIKLLLESESSRRAQPQMISHDIKRRINLMYVVCDENNAGIGSHLFARTSSAYWLIVREDVWCQTYLLLYCFAKVFEIYKISLWYLLWYNAHDSKKGLIYSILWMRYVWEN